MSTKNQLLQKGNHHAYLFECSSTDTLEYVYDCVRTCAGIDPSGHPDFMYTEHGTFGIDESRDISVWQSRRPVVGEVKASVIRVQTITREAQNALLKICEEPVPGTYLFFVVPDIRRILPTLQSRFFIQHTPLRQLPDSGISIADFLEAVPGKRLELIESIYESKDREQAKIFLDALEYVMAKEPIFRTSLPILYRAKEYLSDQGSSIKMLLEMVALSLPRH